MAIVQARGLTKTYAPKSGLPQTAIDGLDLTVGEGEFVGIMGPSGSGKTTLLNLLATIDRPTSGELAIGGQDALALNEAALARFRRDHLGFVFQDYNLLDTMTLRENIALPLALARVSPRQIKQRVMELAVLLGIEDSLDKFPREVSGGQKQRAAAARAIIHNPSLVLADEPTGNLDSRSAGQLMDALSRMNGDRRVTILMATHDPFAASYCGRIVFIRDGRTHSELRSRGDRQRFFQHILDAMATVGDER